MNTFTEISNSNQLMIYLKGLYSKDYDIHVVARDQLKDITPKRKQIIIFNLNKKNEGGSHWVLIYNSDNAVYFDSYGLPIPEEGMNFMKRIKSLKLAKEIIQTTRRVQKLKNDALCGYYCIKFLDEMIVNKKSALDAVLSVNRKNTLSMARKLFRKYSKLF